MTTPQVSIRIGTDGSAQVKNDLAGLGAAGVVAFGDVAKAADASDAALARNAQAVEQVTAAYKAAQGQSVSRADGVTARDSAQVFDPKWFASQERAADQLRQSMDPLYAAQVRYNASVSASQKLLDGGFISQELHNTAVAKAKTVLEEAALAHKHHGDAVRLNAMQVNEFTAIVRHSFDSLASGGNPMTIIAQHAASAAQALGSGEGGVAGSLKAIGAMATTGPAIAVEATLALAVAAGIAAKAMADYEGATSKEELALLGIGRASGLTASQVETMAVAQSDQAKVSVSTARDQEASYLRLGVTSQAVLSSIIGTTKDYSLVTGEDAKNATMELGKALANPAQGVDVLNAKLMMLDATERQHIIDLQQQGDLLGAQEELYLRTQKAVDGAAEHLTGLTKVLEGATTAWSDFWAEMGKRVDMGLDGQTDKDIIDTYNKYGGKPHYANGGGMAVNVTPTKDAFDAATARENAAQQKSVTDAAEAERNRRLIQWQQLKNRADPRGVREQQISSDMTDNDQMLRDGLITKTQHDEVASHDKVNLTRLQRRDELHTPATPGASRAATLAREAESMQVNTQASLDLADAYMKSDSAALKAEASRKAMTDATKKGTDVDSAVTRQLALSLAEQAASSAKAILATRDQTEAQTQVNAKIQSGAMSYRDMNDALKVEAVQRPIVTAMTLDGADAQARWRAELVAATAAQEASNHARDVAAVLAQTGSVNDDIARMKVEVSLLSATNAERRTALALYDAEQEIKRRGLDLNNPDDLAVANGLRKSAADKASGDNVIDLGKFRSDTERGQANDIAAAQRMLDLVTANDNVRQREIDKLRLIQQYIENGDTAQQAMNEQAVRNIDILDKMNQQYDRQRAYFDEIKQTGEDAFDSIGSLMAKGDAQWADWEQAGLHALQSIAAEALKLELLNPLKNWLFHDNLPTAKDSGGFLSTMWNYMSGGTESNTPSISNAHEASHTAGFASGTASAPAGMAWVGENGPELEELPAGTKIYNNKKSMEMMHSGAQRAQGHVVIAPVVKLGGENLFGPLADLVNGIEGHINDAVQEATANAVRQSRRNQQADMDHYDSMGTAR